MRTEATSKTSPSSELPLEELGRLLLGQREGFVINRAAGKVSDTWIVESVQDLRASTCN